MRSCGDVCSFNGEAEVDDVEAEVRGTLYQMVKDAFPHVAEIVGPDLGKHFQEIDGDGWYDAGPYLETITYLMEHISPQAAALIGRQLIEVLGSGMLASGITTPQELLANAPRLYGGLGGGKGGGGWGAGWAASGAGSAGSGGGEAAAALPWGGDAGGDATEKCASSRPAFAGLSLMTPRTRPAVFTGTVLLVTITL